MGRESGTGQTGRGRGGRCCSTDAAEPGDECIGLRMRYGASHAPAGAARPFRCRGGQFPGDAGRPGCKGGQRERDQRENPVSGSGQGGRCSPARTI